MGALDSCLFVLVRWRGEGGWYVNNEMIKLSIAFNITSGQACVKLLIKVYNGWCEWAASKDNRGLLQILVRGYEESKNVAADGGWQVRKFQTKPTYEAWLLAMSANPTKDMNL